MTKPVPGHYSQICEQLRLEQAAEIEQIHYGASHGDRRSQAKLAMIDAYNIKLKHIEELGKFVAQAEAGK